MLRFANISALVGETEVRNEKRRRNKVWSQSSHHTGPAVRVVPKHGSVFVPEDPGGSTPNDTREVCKASSRRLHVLSAENGDRFLLDLLSPLQATIPLSFPFLLSQYFSLIRNLEMNNQRSKRGWLVGSTKPR